MSMHGVKEKRKRKEKGHLAFQVPFLHVLAQSHETEQKRTNKASKINSMRLYEYNLKVKNLPTLLWFRIIIFVLTFRDQIAIPGYTKH